MKTFFLGIFFLFINFANAQILESFPQDQDYYEGGVSKLYQEINRIIHHKNLKPCDSKKEVYEAKLLLTKDSKLKFITDFDTVNITKNKCAYELTLDLLKELKNEKSWKPAVVKDVKYDAIVRLFIVPSHLFGSYKDSYNPYQYYIPATYKGGEKKLNKDVHDNFMSIFEDYHVNGSIYLDFVVDENGEIINPILSPDINNADFKKEIFRTLKRMNGKWNPAYLDGIAIKQKKSLPLKFSVSFNER
ncbi:energy transducer TonB [Epilithonimonas hispanica]|uniref:TonB C-terminal domain-containing protein n=1 Tax=Epilithonimonas hispanica TaxID=358687 RepID=A0A3D9CUD8_9FLAO|nr:hypothetical protein [Epilithonimonas hispanica]REC69248.1 hypothetical protein DRF58_12305 [Epilithonimonas hispanica]